MSSPDFGESKKSTLEDVPMQMVCDQCGKVTELFAQELSVGEDVWEGVVTCRACGYHYHTYFINTALRLKRKRLMKITQGGNISAYGARKAEYKEVYDRFQASVAIEMQRKVGEKAVYVPNETEDSR